MRRRVLIRSIQRLLKPDDHVARAAFMWRLHRWALPLGVVAGAAVALLGLVTGNFESVAFAIAAGIAVGAVASLASAEYRVLALVNDELVMMRGSRTRNVAVEVLERRLPNNSVRLVSSTAVVSDWLILERRFSTTRRYQQEMIEMAGFAAS